MCRLSDRFRSNYSTRPGLYPLNNATEDSPVYVTANYRYSLNCLQAGLNGLPGWVLVLDTQGINVWCAAGEGTFGTDELVKRMESTGLKDQVTTRTLIVPQLGATGVSAHEVRKRTGFRVKFGPIRSDDIPAFVQNNFEATPAMRTVTFTLAERIVLIPMEFFPAAKRLLLILVIAAAVLGLTLQGILFNRMLALAGPFVLPMATALFCGTILHPILLPFFPVRSFALQGFILGLLAALPFAFLPPAQPGLAGQLFRIIVLIGIPALSSYLALNFTGCTPFASRSGVKKELKAAWPLYLVATGILIISLLAYWFVS